MHPRAEAAVLLLNANRIVEILRGVRVDGEAQLLAQVDTIGDVRLRGFVGLEFGAGPAVDEQSLEHGLDVGRAAQLPNDARAAASGPDDDQVAGTDVAAALPVDRDRDVGDEVRLADELLAALVDLNDEEVVQTVSRPGENGGS